MLSARVFRIRLILGISPAVRVACCFMPCSTLLTPRSTAICGSGGAKLSFVAPIRAMEVSETTIHAPEKTISMGFDGDCSGFLGNVRSRGISIIVLSEKQDVHPSESVPQGEQRLWGPQARLE